MPPQQSDRAPGLGNSFSTRPTRAQRREEAARVKADSAPQQNQSPVHETANAPALRPRKKASKIPFNTYISRVTQQRIDWLRSSGDYAVTDIAEVALREFLDRAGVPSTTNTDE